MDFIGIKFKWLLSVLSKRPYKIKCLDQETIRLNFYCRLKEALTSMLLQNANTEELKINRESEDTNER